MLARLKINHSLVFFIITGFVSSLLWLGGDQALELLRFDGRSIINGEIWRVLTGHMVHSNGWHLLLNLSSLLMIGLLFSEHLSAKLWLLVFTLSAIWVSSCYLLFAPQFNYYVGLSAVLYGVIIIGALLDIKSHFWTGWIILLFVTGRVIWQQIDGSVDSLAVIIEDRVAIESHLFGLGAGYLQGILLLIRQRYQAKQTAQSTMEVESKQTNLE